MAEPTPAQPLSAFPVALPPVPTRPRRLVGFPAAPAPLIGREREIAALCELVRQPDPRLITVTGPGGVGKTRLALAVAAEVEAEFADGAVFVPLAAVGSPALVLPAIAQALDIRESPGRPLVEILAAALRDRRLLLVLDNFEHVAEAAVDLFALLEGCPRTTALVTSRAPLRLHDERRFATPPLALPKGSEAIAPDELATYGAVGLFTERARWADRTFALDDVNAAAVVEVCRRLDGLPLAIELAAAWVRVMSPASLLVRLEPRLPLLRGGASDQPARLRTMRDAIAWSFDLLTQDEQLLFRRLAVFVGGFTLEAAERLAEASPASTLTPQPPPRGYPAPVEPGEGGSSVSAGPSASSDAPGVLDLVASLIDKSLLQRMHEQGPEPRFTMLETVREFARERLAASGEEEAIRSAHAAAMADLAEGAEPHQFGPHEQRWMIRLDEELGNLRAALAWSVEHDAVTALRIAAPLWIYWSLYHLPEGRRWLNAALSRASGADDVLRARAMTTEAALASLLGDYTAGEARAASATALAERAGDAVVEATARWFVAANRVSAGQLDGAAPELDRALILFEQAQTSMERGRAAYARMTRGAAALSRGDVERGVADFEQALAQIRDVASASVTVVILSDFGGWLVDLGDSSRARRMFEEALPLAVGAPGRLLVQGVLLGLALVAAVEGDAAAAATILGATETVRIRSGLIFPAHMQQRIDRATALATEALGADAFAAAWAGGRADPETVIAAALAPAEAAATESGGEAAVSFRLSQRQGEVLRLLAEGRTDKEIGAALGLSRRTVSNHVGAILAKLGVDSRTAAATAAVRRGLL